MRRGQPCGRLQPHCAPTAQLEATAAPGGPSASDVMPVRALKSNWSCRLSASRGNLPFGHDSPGTEAKCKARWKGGGSCQSFSHRNCCPKPSRSSSSQASWSLSGGSDSGCSPGSGPTAVLGDVSAGGSTMRGPQPLPPPPGIPADGIQPQPPYLPPLPRGGPPQAAGGTITGAEGGGGTSMPMPPRGLAAFSPLPPPPLSKGPLPVLETAFGAVGAF